MIVLWIVAVYETAVDLLNRQTILLGTPGFRDALIFVHDNDRIMRLSQCDHVDLEMSSSRSMCHGTYY